MTSKARTLVIVGICIVFFFAAIKFSTSSVPRAQSGTGREWLAWTPAERSAFMNGYLTGYLRGTSKACNATDYLFEVDKPHSTADRPSERCHGRVESYSKDLDAYTTVLTDFYKKHPQYENVPSAYLLSFLTDNQFKSADELYEMAQKGELRTNF